MKRSKENFMPIEQRKDIVEMLKSVNGEVADINEEAHRCLVSILYEIGPQEASMYVHLLESRKLSERFATMILGAGDVTDNEFAASGNLDKNWSNALRRRAEKLLSKK